MIAEHYSRDDLEYYVILLKEFHGEYPITEYNTPLKSSKGFTAKIYEVWCSWHTSEVARMLGSKENYNDRIDQMEVDLFPKFRASIEEPPIGHIYWVQGDAMQLNDIFTRYLREVGQGPAGGDDDTFDYWPSAFQTLWDFAEDLDTINKNKAATQSVRDAFKQILKEGDNLEWADEWGFDQFAQELKDA